LPAVALATWCYSGPQSLNYKVKAWLRAFVSCCSGSWLTESRSTRWLETRPQST